MTTVNAPCRHANLPSGLNASVAPPPKNTPLRAHAVPCGVAVAGCSQHTSYVPEPLLPLVCFAPEARFQKMASWWQAATKETRMVQFTMVLVTWFVWVAAGNCLQQPLLLPVAVTIICVYHKLMWVQLSLDKLAAQVPLLRWLAPRPGSQHSASLGSGATLPQLKHSLCTTSSAWKCLVGVLGFSFDATAAVVFAMAVLNVQHVYIVLTAAIGFSLAIVLQFSGGTYITPTYVQLYKLCAAACLALSHQQQHAPAQQQQQRQQLEQLGAELQQGLSHKIMWWPSIEPTSPIFITHWDPCATLHATLQIDMHRHAGKTMARLVVDIVVTTALRSQYFLTMFYLMSSYVLGFPVAILVIMLVSTPEDLEASAIQLVGKPWAPTVGYATAMAVVLVCFACLLAVVQCVVCIVVWAL